MPPKPTSSPEGKENGLSPEYLAEALKKLKALEGEFGDQADFMMLKMAVEHNVLEQGCELHVEIDEITLIITPTDAAEIIQEKLSKFFEDINEKTFDDFTEEMREETGEVLYEPQIDFGSEWDSLSLADMIEEAKKRNIDVNQWRMLVDIAKAKGESPTWIDETFTFKETGKIHVEGQLSLYNCESITNLPDNLIINGDLFINGCTALKKLPDYIMVTGDVYATKTSDEVQEDALRLKREGNIVGEIATT